MRDSDKAVLLMKKAYEQCYTDECFVTKLGETADLAKYNTNHIVNLTNLGKQLIACYSQRPMISYSETKIFDKYFNQLFFKAYISHQIKNLIHLQASTVIFLTVPIHVSRA